MTWRRAAAMAPAAVLAILLAGSAGATSFSITVGDNDGFGFGLPDGGSGDFTNAVQSAAEAASSDGAQGTDLYSAFAPAFDVIFDFEGTLVSAALTVDMGDFQADDAPFGFIPQAYFNDVLQPNLFAFQDGFMNSAVRRFELDAAAIANANAEGRFVVTVDGSSSGDLVAYDFFRLTGDAAIPELGGFALFALGLAALHLTLRPRSTA